MDDELQLVFEELDVDDEVPRMFGEVNKTAVALLLQQFGENLQRRQCDDDAMNPLEVSCEERPLSRALMGYGFLLLYCLALIGNCLNLLIYNSDQIRFFIAIRMLCTKLLMNTLMMTLLVPQALRVIRLLWWETGSGADALYWRFWPYQAYFANVFGFCAMWLTVAMTAECYVYVFFPGHSKALCTKRNLTRAYLLMGVVAMALALIYPLNRTVALRRHCDAWQISITASQCIFYLAKVMVIAERVHTIANLLLAIIVPLALLIFMTSSIVWRLIIRPLDMGGSHQHFSAEKRGVTRITLITTLLQLITETPSVPVLVYAALFGPKIAHICAWQTVSHFLGLCNASLSFFVYISFSNRFRNSIIGRAELLLYKCCPSCFSAQPISALVQSSGKIRDYVAAIRTPNGVRLAGIVPPLNSYNSAAENPRSDLVSLNNEPVTIASRTSTVSSAVVIVGGGGGHRFSGNSGGNSSGALLLDTTMVAELSPLRPSSPPQQPHRQQSNGHAHHQHQQSDAFL